MLREALLVQLVLRFAFCSGSCACAVNVMWMAWAWGGSGLIFARVCGLGPDAFSPRGVVCASRLLTFDLCVMCTRRVQSAVCGGSERCRGR